ncbi:MAG: potassium transporter Kup [Myxococcaceae bacterium]|nr:potassium transporter Kup [Myxococcaceae bacterium]
MSLVAAPPAHDVAPAVTTPGPARLWPLALAALGVVFGDIGTSPLYAVKECFAGAHGLPVTRENVLGILSLFFWSLFMVVAVKYLVFIMRADNRGEGGLFALLALIPRDVAGRLKTAVVLAALFGAALLYGDGIITPAISVLSAVEGLAANPLTGEETAMKPFVVIITCVILAALFSVQRRGTSHIGRIFGPVMVVWFLALSVLGLRWIFAAPEILEALNPVWAVRFFSTHGFHGFELLGAVVLCITGGEALYADMGHFGKRPIRASWWSFVFPALVLNYFGQGALLLEHGERVANPFFATVPEPLLYPMVGLATVATIIASQALISGAYSLTRSAVQLGWFPRITIVHTSREHEGQIYVPEINAALAVACIGLVLAYRESSALASAYGIAVTGTMAITSVVYGFVAVRAWKWELWKALPLVALFLFFDLGFFSANAVKLVEGMGAWFPVAAAAAVFSLMLTWKRGRAELARRFASQAVPLESLLADFAAHPPHRVRGTAVFMSGSPQGTPPVLLHHLKHNQVLHRQVVLLSVVSVDVPLVPGDEALSVEVLDHNFYRVVARTGFMQTPNVPELLVRARALGLVCEPSTTSYYLGRESLLTTGPSRMMRWRKALFAFVSKNARPATAYFGIPPGRVVELGMQVDL